MKLVALTSVALLAASTAFAGKLDYAAPEDPTVTNEAESTSTRSGGGSAGSLRGSTGSLGSLGSRGSAGSGSGAFLIPVIALALIGLALKEGGHIGGDDDD